MKRCKTIKTVDDKKCCSMAFWVQQYQQSSTNSSGDTASEIKIPKNNKNKINAQQEPYKLGKNIMQGSMEWFCELSHVPSSVTDSVLLNKTRSASSEVLLATLLGLNGIKNGLAFGLVALADLLNLLLHLRVQRGQTPPQLLHTPGTYLQRWMDGWEDWGSTIMHRNLESEKYLTLKWARGKPQQW